MRLNLQFSPFGGGVGKMYELNFTKSQFRGGGIGKMFLDIYEP